MQRTAAFAARWGTLALVLLIALALIVTLFLFPDRFLPLGVLLALTPLLPAASVHARMKLFAKPPVYYVKWSLVLTLGFVLNAYVRQFSQGSQVRFDYLGAYVTPEGAPFTVGTAQASDLRLAARPDSNGIWKLEMRATPAGLEVLSHDGVAGLEVSLSEHGGEEGMLDRYLRDDMRWQLLKGEQLTFSEPEVVVRPANGEPSTQVTLTSEGKRGSLTLAGEQVVLSEEGSGETVEILDERLRRRLRQGVRLDHLQWRRGVVPPIASSLVLQLSDEPTRVGAWVAWAAKNIPGGMTVLSRVRGQRYSYEVSSRTSRFEVVPRSPRALTLPYSRLVRVSSAGTRWEFAIRRRKEPDKRETVELLFERRPGYRWTWLPEGRTCSNERERLCTLVASYSIPPSTPLIHVGGVGIDTSRFSLLARIAIAGGRPQIILPERVIDSIGYNDTLRVNARPLTAGAGYIWRLYRAGIADFVMILVGLVGLGLVAFGTLQQMARRWSGDWAEPNGRSYAAPLLCVVIVLLGLRLTLGLRVGLASPYYERATETAVGIWMMFFLVLLGLGTWSSWAPLVVGIVKRVERDGLLRACRDIGLARAAFRLSRRRVRVGCPDGKVAGAAQWIRSRSLNTVLIGGGVIMAAAGFTRDSILFGAGFGVLILASWFAIALFRRHGPGPRTAYWEAVGRSPWGVLIAESRVRYSTLPAFIAAATLIGVMQFFPIALMLGGLAGVIMLFRRVPQLGVLTALSLGLATLFLRQVEIGPSLIFLIVFVVFLLAIRAGIGLSNGSTAAKVPILVVLGAIVLALTWFDFGLGLVFAMPLGAAFLLATRARWYVTTLLVASGAWITWPVLVPDTHAVRTAGTLREESDAFAELGGVARRIGPLRGAASRAVARGLAAKEPVLLERVLVAAGPSATREEILRSLEQVQGARAYAATVRGGGLATGTVIGRGVPTAVSYAENAFAVYVLGEHGIFGGWIVLLLYAALLAIVLRCLLAVAAAREGRPPSDSASVKIAAAVGSVLAICVPAAYVAASNVALVPLTGQNMTFLGLNSWSDAIVSSAMASLLIFGAGDLGHDDETAVVVVRGAQ